MKLTTTFKAALLGLTTLGLGAPAIADQLADIKAAEYALTPGRYVGAAEIENDGEPIDAKLERLKNDLYAAFDESARLESVVRGQLERIDV